MFRNIKCKIEKMRTLKFLLHKEFRQIFRNKPLLAMLFAAPIMQLLVLPLAADFEIKNINITVVDHDRSGYSQQLASKIIASGYFRMIDYPDSFDDAFKYIESDKSDLILEIPAGFEENLIREGNQELFIAINAINGMKGSLGGSYLNRIIAEFNNEIRLQQVQMPRYKPLATIDVANSNWFNPMMNYRFFMVPGILVLLVSMIGAYMSSLNVVRESEIGTIEQINVTPIKKHLFILGKLIPFWVIGMFIFTVGLFGVGWLVYGIVPVGNLLLLYGYLSLYLVAVLGLGLLISTYSQTQQQAMSIAFFFMMIFALMSGLFTPIESMPKWAATLTQFSPITYFIKVMRMIVLKGSGFKDIQYHIVIMSGFAILLNVWAILNYKKTR